MTPTDPSLDSKPTDGPVPSAWAAEWRGILQHLLEQSGDPLGAEVVSYFGTLNAHTAEPYETVAILRANAFTALDEAESGGRSDTSWEVWAFLELLSRHFWYRANEVGRYSKGNHPRSTPLALIGVAGLLLVAVPSEAMSLGVGAAALLAVAIEGVTGFLRAREIKRLRTLAQRFERAAQRIAR